MLQVNAKVPDFALKDQSGNTVTAKALKGTRYLLYFYPKDDTSGCTTQACGVRDAEPDFRAANVKVFGISADSEASHQKFVKKFDLNFPLLADPERQLIEAMGVWVEKSMYGKKYMGIARASFLIDAHGTVEKVWEKVNTATHAQDVLSYLTGGDSAAKAAKPKAASKTVASKTVASKKPGATKAAAKKAPSKAAAPVKKPAAKSAGKAK
jgi:thioredoxin-dependent peroxiredoxin